MLVEAMLVTPCPSGMPLCRKGPATRTRGALAKAQPPTVAIACASVSRAQPPPRPILAGNVPGAHLAPVGARRLVRRIMMPGRWRGLSESRERRKRHCGAEADCGDGLEHPASSQVKRASCREPDAPDNLAAAEAEAAFELHPASLRPSTSLLPSTRKPAPLSFSGQESRFPADEASRACLKSSFLIRLLRYAKDLEGCSRRRRTASSGASFEAA